MWEIWGRLKDYLGRKVWGRDVATLNWPQRLLVNVLRLFQVLLRDVYGGQLTLRATSLAYTSMISLVPLLAVSFSVLKAFGVHNQLEPFLLNLLEPLGPRGNEIARNTVGFIENVRVGVLGSVGLIFLLYTAISLIQQLEDAFNYVWRVENLRGLMHRFSDYLSVVLIGPVLLFSALGMAAAIIGADMVQRLAAIEPLGTVIAIAGQSIPYLLMVMALVFVFVFLPNTKVGIRAAIVGAVFAVALWQVTGRIFASFVVASGRYEAIYSGFAVVLLSMLWLYLIWLILLIGAQVAFYQQYPQFIVRSKETLVLGNRMKEQLALLVMFLIGSNFYNNCKPWTFEGLVQRLELPLEPLRRTLEVLEQKGLIVKAGSDPIVYLPARDLGTLSVRQFLAIIRGDGDEAHFRCSIPQVEQIMGRINAALDGALKNETLEDLIVSMKDN